jgi:hypothetical protein
MPFQLPQTPQRRMKNGLPNHKSLLSFFDFRLILKFDPSTKQKKLKQQPKFIHRNDRQSIFQ